MNRSSFLSWGDDTLALAKAENKIIFACIIPAGSHSGSLLMDVILADKRVSDLLTTRFIPVLEEREHRPDLAAVCLKFCRTLGSRVGWPLNVFFLPDGRPFFATAALLQEGPEAFVRLLEALQYKWAQNPKELKKAAEDAESFMNRPVVLHPDSKPESLPLAAAKQLSDSYDSEYGGFGHSTKYPTPQNLLFLLRYASVNGDTASRKSALHTLQQMYRGGIYDHFAGGFSHFSTDREWLVPQFEKLLTDNAQLILVYIEAWKEGHFALYRTIAEETLAFCLRDLKSVQGGYYLGLAADASGVEGAARLFTPDEVCSVLGEEAGKHFAECYDISTEANYNGKSIPNLLLNNRWNMLPEGYEDYRRMLRTNRQQDIAAEILPARSAESNAWMLSALAKACSVFGNYRYLQEAHRQAEFLSDLFHNGQLDAEPGSDRNAGLRGYAAYGLALLDLYAADYNPDSLQRAEELASAIQKQFSDPHGGYYDAAISANTPVIRPKDVYDDEQYSGNGTAAQLFGRLARLTGKSIWKDAYYELMQFISAAVGPYPAGCTSALCEAVLSSSFRTIVCVSEEDLIPEQLDAIASKYAPGMEIVLKTPSFADALSVVAPLTSDMHTSGGKTAFYIYDGNHITGPVTL